MPLYNHQKRAIDFITKKNGIGALFHDIGCGKTLTALSVFKELRKIDDTLKLLVICPLSLIEAAWGEDIKKFTNLTYLNLHSKKLNPNKKFLTNPDIFKDINIFIINYEWLLSKKNEDHLNQLFSEFSFMCVLDESSRIKNHKAKTTKAILNLKDRFKFRIVMSGTPAPNCETEYWSQMTFLSSGIFHHNFFAFRNTYFHLQRGDHKMNGRIVNRAVLRDIFKKGWRYEMTDINRKKLISRMAPCCHLAKKDECLDLPDQIDEFRYVEMSSAQRKNYKEMRINAITEISQFKNELTNPIVARIVLTKLMKLRQITSGFAIDDFGKTHSIDGNVKLADLLNLLEEIGKKQVIIWCQFHYEIELIKKVLAEKATTLYGKTKDKEESISDFKNNKVRYMIAHPASAGHGLTFTNCNIQIFFSLDYSFERYEQSRGRIHRIGQNKKCVYIHIICPETIDQDIYNILKKKESVVQVAERWLKND